MRLAAGLFVARVVVDEARVVLEGILVGIVGAELGRHFARRAVDVLGGGHLRHLARPALAGLDAEQVEGIAAVLAADLAAAPAGLVPGLAEHEARGDAAFLRHALGCVAVVLHEAVAALGCGGVGVGRRRGARGLLRLQAQRGRRGKRGRGLLAAADLARELALDGFREPALQARHLHRELLVQHVLAQVALLAFHQAGLHRRLAHALDHLAHEERFELLGRFLRGLRVVLPGLELQRIQRARIHRQRIRGRGGGGGRQAERHGGLPAVRRWRTQRPSDDLQFGIERTRGLDGLQDGQQVLRRGAQRVERAHHVGELRRGRHLDDVARLLLDRDVALLRDHGLALRERIGLADHRRGTDRDRQVAVRDRAGAQRHGLVEHDGAGACIDHDLGRRRGVGQRNLFQVGDEVHAATRVLRGAHLHRAAIQRRGDGRALAELVVDGPRHLARGLEIRGVKPEVDRVAVIQRRGHRTLHLRAFGNAARAQMVDLHLAAAGRGACATDHQVALRQRVDLAVGAAQRRGDQRAALERLGIAHGGHVHVDELPGLGERRQLRRHDHRGHVLELRRRRAGRQADPHLLQVVGECLRGDGHLRRLVARAVQAHDQAVARQLVAAHPLHGRHFLDAQRVRGRHRPQQGECREAVREPQPQGGPVRACEEGGGGGRLHGTDCGSEGCRGMEGKAAGSPAL